jgi:hypothetical protein
MAELFNNQPGVVVALNTGNGGDNPFRVTIDGFPENGAQGGIILTEVAVQRHGNFQFLHTLQDLVYVYSFGERIGQIRASGMAFARTCGGAEGLTVVLNYYEANRLEVRADPVSIVIGTGGSGRFRGFLTELNADVSRPEARLAQFGLQFHALPSATGGGAYGFGGGYGGGYGGDGSGGGGGGGGGQGGGGGVSASGLNDIMGSLGQLGGSLSDLGNSLSGAFGGILGSI